MQKLNHHLPVALLQIDEQANDTLVISPRGLGLGKDRIVGGPSGTRCRRLDLSQLAYPVEITWTDTGSGTISDGADCIVFRDVEEIILPECMAQDRAGPAARPAA